MLLIKKNAAKGDKYLGPEGLYQSERCSSGGQSTVLKLWEVQQQLKFLQMGHKVEKVWQNAYYDPSRKK